MFKDIILELIFKEFGLCATELMQLHDKQLEEIENVPKLCETLLNQIVLDEIKSVHVSKIKAKKILKFVKNYYLTNGDYNEF
ncbi:MAG: hypothetical protein KAX49_13725 [Halanaerobiales bacterium]|nr:hypothetical protein [Halanaerobiales bacterium]